MEELNRQLTQAEADRIQIEAMLRNVRVGSADWLPEVRDNPVVQQLSEKLADAQSQLAQATVVYGKNHPNVKKLQNQVDELNKQLSAQKLAIVGSIRSSYDAANAREQLMNSQIKGTTSQLNQMARYNALKKDAQANSELYNSLYARVKEAGIAAASKSSNLRVVDEARVLDSPTRPNRLLNLVVGMMAALMGGIALAFLREQIDARIFTPEDMRHSSGTANVSIVPEFFLPGQNLLPGAGQREAAAVPANGKGENFGPWVRLLLEEPHSPGAEALRALYTSVVLSRSGNPPQVAMVVSSLPGEGKTTVAVNLAIAMAQHGSTCIVDADLRRGRVASEFGITTKFGLSDVLASARFDQACLCCRAHGAQPDRGAGSSRQSESGPADLFGNDERSPAGAAIAVPFCGHRLRSAFAVRGWACAFDAGRWFGICRPLRNHHAPRDAPQPGAAGRGAWRSRAGVRSQCRRYHFSAVSLLPVRLRLLPIGFKMNLL